MMLLLTNSRFHLAAIVLVPLLAIESIQKRLKSISIDNLLIARLICRLIPSHCPFAREIRLFDRMIVRIPPLCKLNPFYDQLMTWRFQASSYLATVDRV
jgi:Mo-dependent nitrogenase C-terminus